MREKLIKFIGQMDKEQMTKKEHQLLDALKGSSENAQKEAGKLEEDQKEEAAQDKAEIKVDSVQ